MPEKEEASSSPSFLSEVEVFLRVDLAVLTVCVGMTELHTLLDHVLEHVDQVRLLELRRFAIRLAPELALAPVIVLAQKLPAACAEFRDADEFSGRLLVRNAAVHAQDPAILHQRFLGIVRRMLGPRLI